MQSSDIRSDLLFAAASGIVGLENPCLCCVRALLSDEGCGREADCARLRAYLSYRRSQKKRLEAKASCSDGGACHTCLLSFSCPFSFEEDISFCPVKTRACQILASRGQITVTIRRK